MEEILKNLSVKLNRFNTRGEAIQMQENGEVFLSKPFETVRKIGKVIIKDNIVIYQKEEKEEDIVKKFNGWSINNAILQCVNIVQYVTDIAIYQIDFQTAVRHGIKAKWGINGLDEKVVVPLEFWDKKYNSPQREISNKLFGKSWGELLYKEIEQDYFKSLTNNLAKARKVSTVFPENGKVFSAFHKCSFEKLKVVIIAQEPYSTGSDGLAYSCDKKASPILVKMHNMIEKTVYEGFMLDKNPDLSVWAEQGVLLLHKIMTVRKNKPNSHLTFGWDTFTNNVISLICDKKPNVVFITLERYITIFLKGWSKENLFKNPHYSYLDDNEEIFLLCNKYLKSKNISPIYW